MSNDLMDDIIKDHEAEKAKKMKTIVQLLNLIEVHDTAYHLAQKYDLDYTTLEDPIELTVEHIFTEFESIDGGTCHFSDYVTFWNNFDKVVELLHANGHKLSRDFFATNSGKIGMFINAVCETGVEDAIFKPEYWAHSEREMVATFYLMKSASQTKLNLEKIRKALAEHQGKECRFYQTKQALDAGGHAYVDIFRKGEIEKYDEAMHSAGLVPSKEDFFVDVGNGKSLLHDKDHIKNFSKWAKYFANYGDYFTAEDLSFKYGTESSLLERAVTENVLNEIFNPSCWIDNLEEMKRLWQYVPQGKSPSFDFLHAYTEAEDASYHVQLPLNNELTKEMLFAPVVNHGDHKKNVIPLGLPWVWENFSVIQEILTKKGTPITLDDMKVTSGLAEESVAIKAIRFGAVHHFMSLVSPSKGHILDHEMCATKTSIGTSLLGEIAHQYELESFFQPQYWVGNVNCMVKLWGDVKDNMAKDHVKDFGSLVSMANAITIRQQGLKRASSRRAPKP